MQCFRNIRAIRRRDPYAKVNARDHFLTISQYASLDAYREPNEDELKAVEEIGKIAYESRRKKDDDESKALDRQAGGTRSASAISWILSLKIVNHKSFERS